MNGELFEDNSFPPMVNRIIKEENRGEKAGFEDGVEWARAHELEELAGDDLELYKDGIRPADIK